jgi:hypothetical protein
MFAPSADKAQFLELANLTSHPIPLFDPARPQNVWIIDGVGSFAFPPNTVLEPCATLIVCSTNPASFRAQYGLGTQMPVYGPWSGRLDNDGETVRLLQPGTPELDGTIPYYRVDHVTYRTNAPWPLVATGASLDRIPLEALGNDPVYWRPRAGGNPGATSTNRPPFINVFGDPIIPQETELVLTLAAADLDVPWQSAELSAVLLPPGSTFDPVLGKFSWVPHLSQGPGEFLARFTATDDAACAPLQSTFDLVIQVTASLSLSADYADGQLQLRFVAQPGTLYQLEFAPNLTTHNWQLLQKVSVPQNQVVTIVDPSVGGNTTRFYRLRSMP